MELVNPKVEEYVLQHTGKEDAILYELYLHTLQQHPQQHMQSSWVQGQVLSFFSYIAKPRYILEIGTFTGFSAICLAKGLQPDGELHTIELRENDAQTAQANFNKFKNSNQIHLHTGNALDIIPGLPYQWDLVFIDADKTGYIDYYELVLPMLNKGGLIIADNVLFHGQVMEEEVKGKNAIAIHNFNQHVANDDRTEQVILSVRDGLMLIKKK